MEGYISAQQAARRLGVHVTTIRRWCQSGRLPHKQIGARYRVLDSAVMALADQPPSAVIRQTEFLFVAEAARLLGLSPGVVQNWCRLGKLPARKLGKRWQIPRQAVVELAQVSGGSPLMAGSDYSPLDLRLIKDEYVRDEVAAGNIPHPYLVTGDDANFDWQAWEEERLPLQVAEREWHARRAAETAAPDGPSPNVTRVHLLDRLMTNARRFMDEAIAQTGAFSNHQIQRLVTHDQPHAYVDLLASFPDPHPFGCANRLVGARIRFVAEQSGYVRAPDLDRNERDFFGNPVNTRFYRRPPVADPPHP